MNALHPCEIIHLLDSDQICGKVGRFATSFQREVRQLFRLDCVIIHTNVSENRNINRPGIQKFRIVSVHKRIVLENIR